MSFKGTVLIKLTGNILIWASDEGVTLFPTRTPGRLNVLANLLTLKLIAREWRLHKRYIYIYMDLELSFSR